MLGRLRDEEHDVGELAFLEATELFHSKHYRGAIEYAKKVPRDSDRLAKGLKGSDIVDLTHFWEMSAWGWGRKQTGQSPDFKFPDFFIPNIFIKVAHKRLQRSRTRSLSAQFQIVNDNIKLDIAARICKYFTFGSLTLANLQVAKKVAVPEAKTTSVFTRLAGRRKAATDATQPNAQP